VLVLPGGGYGGLAHTYEGDDISRWLNANGFHAATLRYRVAPNRHPGMIHDVQRAMRLIRSRAGEWGVDAGRVGILGFSAGGHLASSAAVHFDRFTSAEDDLAGKFSARPDAAVLCYPVIDFGEFANVGSRNNLLGEKQDPALVELLSNHKAVTDKTPPTFIWHTSDDQAVPMENALLFAMACRAKRVPVEVHSYESGRHGLGLAGDSPDVAGWGELCVRFLKRHLEK